MGNILVNAFSFLLAIFLGFGMKRVGILKQADGVTISKIIVYVTLPATIINGVNGTRIGLMTLSLMGAGVLSNAVLIFAGYLFSAKMSKGNRGLMMFAVSGFNIGNFAIPFAQMFMPYAVAFLAMFDIGNAFMVTGATQIIVDDALGESDKAPPIIDVLRRLLRAPVFMVYLVMILLSLFQLTIPESFLPPIRFLASANSFLPMFAIGLFLKIQLHKEGLATVRKLLLTRFLATGTLAVMIYFLLPLPLFIRQVLVLVMLAPIGNLSIIQAVDFGSDEGTSGLASSVSIILSLILMSIAVMLMI